MKTAENLKRQLGGALRSARRIFVTAIIAMLLTTSLMTQARTYADDLIPQSLGDLDISFGNGGRVMTQVKVAANGGSSGSAIAIQNDGKLVVAGGVYATGPGSRIPNSYDFGLARYQTDGSLDTNFGSSGKINTNFFGFDDSAVAVVVQPDGKIIAAGEAQKTADALSSDFGLARYNADGSLDVTFGNGGKVLTDFFGFSDICRALASQPDGKILAAGNAATTGTSGNTFAIARYNPDGSLDASFGTGGKVTAEFLVGSNPVCYALLVQPDGKIIGIGNSGVGIALVRYNSNGTLDSSFGTAGKTTTTIAFPNSVSASAAALQPDGRLVVAGSEYHKLGSTDFALARYTSNGVLDSSFGNSGLVATSVFGYDRAYAVSVRPDGKIVAAGQVSVYKSDDGGDFGLAQYNPDGTLDTSFGNGGVVHTDVHGGFFDRANAIVVQPDSRIVLAGGTEDSNGVVQEVALARYGVSTLPPAARLPVIQGAIVQGKQLIISGFNYDIGAKVFVDGQKQKTANDDQQPENKLIAVKAGKFIAQGQTVIVIVKNTDGRLSNSFTFTRP